MGRFIKRLFKSFQTPNTRGLLLLLLLLRSQQQLGFLSPRIVRGYAEKEPRAVDAPMRGDGVGVLEDFVTASDSGAN